MLQGKIKKKCDEGLLLIITSDWMTGEGSHPVGSRVRSFLGTHSRSSISSRSISPSNFTSSFSSTKKIY